MTQLQRCSAAPITASPCLDICSCALTFHFICCSEDLITNLFGDLFCATLKYVHYVVIYVCYHQNSLHIIRKGSTNSPFLMMTN